jgi:hypothetical protein
MNEKVCAVLIGASLIVLVVAADWLIQGGIRRDASAVKADAVMVGRN